jgi:hypothetical protein
LRPAAIVCILFSVLLITGHLLFRLLGPGPLETGTWLKTSWPDCMTGKIKHGKALLS